MRLALILALAACAPPSEWRAIDGDTVLSPEGERIRLLWIDAPEMPSSPRDCRRSRCPNGDPYAAQAALQAALDAGVIGCVGDELDVYGRRLAECFASDGERIVSINEWMLSTGLVSSYERP